MAPAVEIVKSTSQASLEFRLKGLKELIQNPTDPIRTDTFGPGYFIRIEATRITEEGKCNIVCGLHQEPDYPSYAVSSSLSIETCSGEQVFQRSYFRPSYVAHTIYQKWSLTSNFFESISEVDEVKMNVSLTYTPVQSPPRQANHLISQFITGKKSPSRIVSFIVFSGRNTQAATLCRPRILHCRADLFRSHSQELFHIYELGFVELNGEILNDPGTFPTRQNEQATPLHIEDIDFDIINDGNGDDHAIVPVKVEIADSDAQYLLALRCLSPLSTEDRERETTMVIPNAAARTWEAVLFWLYTGHISFTTPLQRPTPDSSTDWPRSCSSKAVYRIATALKLESLRQLAFVAIEQRITKDNALDELFTYFTASHNEIMKMEIVVVIKNWKDLRDSHFQRKMKEMAEGKYPFGHKIMAELMKRLAVVNADR